jgi:predicted MFS family arabinose efflux permease
MMAFAPSLVGRELLSTALALNSVTYNVGRALGPILGAAVINVAGAAWAFGINSCSYIALLVGLVSVRPLTRHATPATRPKLRESIGLVRRNRRLAGLLCAILAMNIATDPPITLGPPFMSRIFHHAATLSGVLIGGFGAGAIVAAFTFAHRLQGTRRTVMAALAATGAGLAAFSVAPNLWWAFVALFVLGVGYLASNTAATSRLQTEVADEHRGRIMTLWSIAFLGARPLASIVDGSLASTIGLRAASFAMSLPALTAAVVLFGIGIARRRA